MVLLCGLELVAAGYLIHKHAQNKERQRLTASSSPPPRRRSRSLDRKPSHYHHDHPTNHRSAATAPAPWTAPPAPGAARGSYPPAGWPTYWPQPGQAHPAPQYPGTGAPQPYRQPYPPYQEHYAPQQPAPRGVHGGDEKAAMALREGGGSGSAARRGHGGADGGSGNATRHSYGGADADQDGPRGWENMSLGSASRAEAPPAYWP